MHIETCIARYYISFPSGFQGVIQNSFSCLYFGMSDGVSLPLISNCSSTQHLPDGLPNFMEILQHTFHILVHLTVLPIDSESAPAKNCK